MSINQKSVGQVTFVFESLPLSIQQDSYQILLLIVIKKDRGGGRNIGQSAGHWDQICQL